MQAIIAELRTADWARSLISKINENGGIIRANKALLFELRFGYALSQTGLHPNYEVRGEGESTIDYGFTSNSGAWAVELMRLEETDATRRATRSETDEDGIEWSSQTLSSRGADPAQSEEGETLKAVQRICQKFERNGRPHKFPQPATGCWHALVVDLRTFLTARSDVFDMAHIALGGSVLTNDFHRRYWQGQLISGVFDERTSVRGAIEARQRLHFLGFVNEEEYAPGQFAAGTTFFANPFLFQQIEDVRTAMATWPLQPMRVVNAHADAAIRRP